MLRSGSAAPRWGDGGDARGGGVADSGVAGGSGVGSVRDAAVAYYEQDEHRYMELQSDEHHEISGFIGNISIRDGVPFLHAHATFCAPSGAAVGGHLVKGCEVVVAEVTIREMTGVVLGRTPGEANGLALRSLGSR